MTAVAVDDLTLKVAHLLRRAGFGAGNEAVEAAAGQGLVATVEALLADADPPQPLIPPGQEGDFAGLKPVKGIRDLQLLWLQRMVETPSPLQEKLTLFWHNHFATADSKVNNRLLMGRQNDCFRSRGFGAFADLLLAVSRDPAMLIWLDGNANHKRAPNENYAREVMELFTLGIGNYTEADVHAGAQAFTGWHVHDGEFVFQDNDHDHSLKTYLGHTGDLDGTDAVAILASHPATARWISTKLWRWFAYANPEPVVIDDLAAVYLNSNGNIRSVLRALFLHDAFYSEAAPTGQIKNPAEFVVQSLRALNQKADMAAVAALGHMGMELFNPPNVAGWPGGLVWVNAATLLARFNWANRLVLAMGNPAADDDISLAQLAQLAGLTVPTRMLDYWLGRLGNQQLSEASRTAVLGYVGDAATTVRQLITKHRQCLHAVLSAPEYQLN